jgi:hypothetical protein
MGVRTRSVPGFFMANKVTRGKSASRRLTSIGCNFTYDTTTTRNVEMETQNESTVTALERLKLAWADATEEEQAAFLDWADAFTLEDLPSLCDASGDDR